MSKRVVSKAIGQLTKASTITTVTTGAGYIISVVAKNKKAIKAFDYVSDVSSVMTVAFTLLEIGAYLAEDLGDVCKDAYKEKLEKKAKEKANINYVEDLNDFANA